MLYKEIGDLSKDILWHNCSSLGLSPLLFFLQKPYTYLRPCLQQTDKTLKSVLCYIMILCLLFQDLSTVIYVYDFFVCEYVCALHLCLVLSEVRESTGPL